MRRTAFTLTELMVVMGIISVLASSLLFAMFTTIDDAKTARTKAQVTKLHDQIMTRWDAYQTRAVRFQIIAAPQNGYSPQQIERWARKSLRDYPRQDPLNGVPPIRRSPGSVAIRLVLLRDLMRLEMPDRKTDVIDAPFVVPYRFREDDETGRTMFTVGVTTTRTAISRKYYRQAAANPGWTEQYQDAECLYMIVSSIRDISENGLGFLHEGEIGDTDQVDTDGDGVVDQIGDGMPEILDAWGKPIAFIRWPAGFVVHPKDKDAAGNPDYCWGDKNVDDDGNGVVDDYAEAGFPGSNDIHSYSTIQPFDVDTNHYVVSDDRDPFDPLRVDNRQGITMAGGTARYYFNFALYPLICSGGPDEVWDIVRFDYDPATPNNLISFDFYRSLSPSAPPPPNWPSGWPWPWPVLNDPYSIMPNSKRRLGEPFLDSTGYADNITNHALGD